jgi:hypothetical protein
MTNIVLGRELGSANRYRYAADVVRRGRLMPPRPKGSGVAAPENIIIFIICYTSFRY